jgi:hypothetical protein
MPTQTEEITAREIATFEDVKLLASASSPCVTILINIRDPRELSPKLKGALRNVEQQSKENLEGIDADSILEPIRGLARTAELAGIWSNTLALFRSPGLFQYYVLHQPTSEIECVAKRFQVRALLAALAREQSFLLLGLSRGNIRLLHCTQHRAEDENLRGLVPRDLRAWLNTRQPDHVLQNRSTAGNSVGSMGAVSFGTSTDREHEDDNLAHFYKAVDSGINTLLRGSATRLLLAGTDEEAALYRRITNYPHLFENHVRGATDGVTDASLHRRALDVVMRSPSGALEQALADYSRRADGRVSFQPLDAVRAAFGGRVSDLFIANDAELRGICSAATIEVDTTQPGEDLLNAAALQTLLHGGRAFVLDKQDMPSARDVVAVLRY